MLHGIPTCDLIHCCRNGESIYVFLSPSNANDRPTPADGLLLLLMCLDKPGLTLGGTASALSSVRMYLDRQHSAGGVGLGTARDMNVRLLLKQIRRRLRMDGIQGIQMLEWFGLSDTLPLE